jgi:hypothetical protein
MDTWASTTVYQGSTALIPARLANTNYGWEQTKKLEMALETGFLKDRILFTASWYQNRSGNQLVGLSLPQSTGFSSITANRPALVQNMGLEFELNTVNIKTRSFSWTVSANLTIPRNKLVSYPNIAGSNYATTLIVGQPLTIARTYHYTGVNPQTGVYQFQSLVHGGNTYTPSYPGDLATFVNVGQHYYGGLQNSLRYKNWEIDFLVQFVNQTGKNALVGGAFGPPGESFTNAPIIVLNRWQKPGDNAQFQKFTTGAGSSPSAANGWYTDEQYGDNAYSDASFIRLKNLSISYQLPVTWMKKLRLQQSKIYIQGQNLFTITSYKGMDPENQSTNLTPPVTMLTGGIQLTF